MTTSASGKTTRLTVQLNPSDVTLTTNSDVGVTKGRLYLKNNLQEEWISFSGVAASGSNYVYSGLVRGLSQTADPATVGTGLTWLVNQQCVLVAMHDQLPDRQDGMKCKVYADTTARDADLTSPTNGMTCYVTADGVFYDYQSGAWATRANGATPNASTTVAGKVEIATTAESKAGTSTGGTGAYLSANPSDIAANTQSGTFVY